MESPHLLRKLVSLSVSFALFYFLGLLQRVFYIFSALRYGIDRIAPSAFLANEQNLLESKQQQKERWAREENPATLSYNGTLKEIVQQQADRALGDVDIPECFVLPPNLQPGFSKKGDPKTANLPLIDMTGVYTDPERRKEVARSISEACSTWGFFQVVGHGVPEELRERMLAEGRKFFELPMSEKAKFQNDWADPSKPILGRSRLSTTGHHSWRDSFRHVVDPVTEAQMKEWPTKPELYIDTATEYNRATKKLATTIFELIAEGLNLKSQSFYDVLGGPDQIEYHLMLGYYPQCPQPEKALGLIGHTDPNLITLLVQDEPGLEILKDGLWIPVEPAKNGFVINIGDSLQIMSNDRYKSNEHRVLVSKRRDRMSAMIFVTPKPHVNLSVVRELVPSNATAIFNDIPWGSYLKFARQGLDTKLTKLALK